MTTLITGCRGKVGSTLLALLHESGADVRAASARPTDLELPEGIDSVRLALDDPTTFATALESIDSVFLYADPSHIDAFVDAAHTAGVGHIVLLSSSAVLAPEAAGSPLAAMHIATERALADGSVPFTVLRPGAFAGNALQWAHALRSTGVVELPYPGSHGDPLHELDLAEAAMAVLTDPLLRGGTHHLTGPESLAFTEQIAILERAAGRTTPIEIRRVTREEWQQSASAHMPSEFARGLLDYWASTDGSPAPLTGTVEELTGRPARTFAQWATEHAAAFRA